MKKVLLTILIMATLLCCFGCKYDGALKAVDATDVLQEDFAIAIKKNDSEMKQAVNEVIDEWLLNGKLDLYHDYYDALASGEEIKTTEGLTLEWSFDGYTDVIEMYTEATFAPYEFYYNNEIKGVDVAIMSEVAVRTGAKLVIKDVKFETVISGMNASNEKAVAAAGLTVSEERKKTCDFSSVYASSTLSIVQKDEDNYNSLKSLNGLTIGVQQGTSGDLIVTAALSASGYDYVYTDDDGNEHTENIKISGKIVRFESYTAGLETLKIGKLDVIFMDKLPASLLVANA